MKDACPHIEQRLCVDGSENANDHSGRIIVDAADKDVRVLDCPAGCALGRAVRVFDFLAGSSCWLFLLAGTSNPDSAQESAPREGD